MHLGSGPLTSKICILARDTPGKSASMEKIPFFGWEREFLSQSLLSAGIHPSTVRFEEGVASREAALEIFAQMPNLEVIIPVDDTSLTWVTGKKSLEKWHLSKLDTEPDIAAPKALPTFSPKRIRREFKQHLFTNLAFTKVADGLTYSGPWKRKEKIFQLNPNYEETMDTLLALRSKNVLACDIETGRGQINTVGFAWSPNHAIAIGTLPDRLSADKYYKLWSLIAGLLENRQIGKVYQNLTYETMFFSQYGIDLQNYYHDTMWAQRVLYAEHKVGLDNVGRMYTDEPYWKDVGRENAADEGATKDWGDIRDWQKHYLYNCLDTSGTFEAMENQRIDLERRGKLPFFDGYLMKLADPIKEMCSRGLPLCEQSRAVKQTELEELAKQTLAELSEPINPRSPAQVKAFLKGKKYRIPVKNGKESTDELALKKLRLKHPEDTDIQNLLKLAKVNKALSSYVKIEAHSDGNIRYQINGVGTETLRFASTKDPWGKGLNAQTLPKKYKSLYAAPEGKMWLQIDLKQAESRFVAYECADYDLITMLEDSTKDIHKFVASHIFSKPESEIVKSERQLGKKSGHGANYDMGWATFQNSCLKEMDLVLSKAECINILETYHRLFPGIRRGHAAVRDELYRNRCLTNPFGYTRYFYGRMEQKTFGEAYAFKPQSTIPGVTNYLMLSLLEQRKLGKLDFALHLQVHDSVVLSVADREQCYLPIIEHCLDTKVWHPEIILSAGKLVIPTSIELGRSLGETIEFDSVDEYYELKGEL